MCGTVWYKWGRMLLRRTACTRFTQESSLPFFLALLLLYKQKINLILSISIYRKASVFNDASVGRIHSSAMPDSTHRPHLHNYVTKCLHTHAYRHMLLTCIHTHTQSCIQTPVCLSDTQEYTDRLRHQLIQDWLWLKRPILHFIEYI